MHARTHSHAHISISVTFFNTSFPTTPPCDHNASAPSTQSPRLHASSNSLKAQGDPDAPARAAMVVLWYALFSFLFFFSLTNPARLPACAHPSARLEYLSPTRC